MFLNFLFSFVKNADLVLKNRRFFHFHRSFKLFSFIPGGAVASSLSPILHSLPRVFVELNPMQYQHHVNQQEPDCFVIVCLAEKRVMLQRRMSEFELVEIVILRE